MKRKVKIFKEGKEVGWSKTDYGAVNNVINTCRQHGFDIRAYKIFDYETHELLWDGSKEEKDGIRKTSG